VISPVSRICCLALLALAGAASATPALEQGLLAYLPLRSDLRDHAAAPHEVEVSGRVELRAGAAYFGGKEDWLELPYLPLNDRPFAIAVWLKPTGAGPTYGVLEQWDTGSRGHLLHLMIRNGLRPWFGFYINDVVSPVSLSNAGDWQHVVFRYDGTHQQIWINARLVCQRSAEAYRGVSGRTCIGKNPAWNNVPGRDYEGWMSDFRIYDRAISFEEIIALAATPPAPITVLASAAPAQPAGSVSPTGASEIPLLAIDAEKMQLRGKPGEEYIVEASEDLEHWKVIGALPVGTSGLVEFVDEDAASFRQRFYRIRYRVPE
jgi:hypothetical protein